MAFKISSALIVLNSCLQFRRRYIYSGTFVLLLLTLLLSFDIHADDWLENRIKTAEKGDAAAQFHVGLTYDVGNSVPEDNMTALHWYQKTAEQGEVRAQVNLGAMYARGDGVNRDYVTALHWYKKAAEQEFAMAQFNVGLMYDFGTGVQENKSETVHWYQKAAKQGDALAQLNLAVKLYNGEGVAEDRVQAYAWIDIAADRSNDDKIIDIKEIIADQLTPAEITAAQNLLIELAKTISIYRSTE